MIDRQTGRQTDKQIVYFFKSLENIILPHNNMIDILNSVTFKKSIQQKKFK
jgi:hypothetical protein